MLNLKDWLDECFSLELRDVRQEPHDAINVIIYDKTNVPPGGARTVGERVKSAFTTHESLTFWWKAGSFIDQLQGFAAYALGAADWNEALTGAMQAVDRQRQKTGQATTLASLQFWGHGSPGRVFMGNDDLRLGAGGAHRDIVAKVAAHMHPQRGHVWFRCCCAFQGAPGQTFAKAAAQALGVPVVGHTFIIHLLQSGTRVLRPGGQPDWSVDEGVGQHGNRKGVDLISSPSRPRTVTMARLYPPLEPGDIVIPSLVLGALKLGVLDMADDEE